MIDVQGFLDHLQASGAGASVALAALLVLVAIALIVRGWRS